MSKRSRLLVVEDDPSVQALLVAYLEKDDYQVFGASTAAEAEGLLQTSAFDMVLLDLGLPDEDGLVVARRLRSKSEVPIVFVTQRSGDSDKITALEMGGDDYILKPFNPRELSARIKNILVRAGVASRRAANSHILSFGQWFLDVHRRTLRDQGGSLVDLTRAEFDLLRALAMANGRVLNRNSLLDAINAQGDDGSDRSIDVLISRLRRKMEPNEKPPKLIITVPGYGYRLSTGIGG